jgi:phosphopantothenoylcysteine synthetase/decarboxylase
MSQSRRIKVLITGGPTRAFLDEVRYLSNLSTGGLAFALCEKLSKSFDVALVIGPTGFEFGKLDLKRRVRVETNQEMRAAVLALCRSFRPDVAIFSAAVLDFEPVLRRKGKVSSKEKHWTVELRPAPKIIDEVSQRFPEIRQIGFKLETKKRQGLALRRFAAQTIQQKKLEGLCVNFLSEVGATSHHAYLFTKAGELTRAKTKQEIASWIAKHIPRHGKDGKIVSAK